MHYVCWKLMWTFRNFNIDMKGGMAEPNHARPLLGMNIYILYKYLCIYIYIYIYTMEIDLYLAEFRNRNGGWYA